MSHQESIDRMRAHIDGLESETGIELPDLKAMLGVVQAALAVASQGEAPHVSSLYGLQWALNRFAETVK